MKFNFERGKKQLLEWMDNEFDCSYGYSLQYIKELSDMDDIESEVESFRLFERSWEEKISSIKKATTMREVFEALEDTAIESDDNFIIDHINADKKDNRLVNLQCITRSENLLKHHRVDKLKTK